MHSETHNGLSTRLARMMMQPLGWHKSPVKRSKAPMGVAAKSGSGQKIVEEATPRAPVALKAPPSPTRVIHFTGDVRAMTRLSVLVDRIVRCQAQLALGDASSQADKVLERSLQKASQLVDALSKKTWCLESKARWGFVKQSYRDFFAKNTQLPAANSSGELAKLADLAEGLGAASDMLAAGLIQDMGTLAHTLIVTARLQRLTQQLAAYYLLAAMGIDKLGQQLKMEQGRALFAELLATLRHSKLGTEAIGRQHEVLQQQWSMMQQALEGLDTQATDCVLRTSDHILLSLTALFTAYEDALETA
jgi:hypothetical protein